MKLTNNSADNLNLLLHYMYLTSAEVASLIINVPVKEMNDTRRRRISRLRKRQVAITIEDLATISFLTEVDPMKLAFLPIKEFHQYIAKCPRILKKIVELKSGKKIRRQKMLRHNYCHTTKSVANIYRKIETEYLNLQKIIVLNFPVSESCPFGGEALWVRIIDGNCNDGTGEVLFDPRYSNIRKKTVISFAGGTAELKPSFIGAINVPILLEPSQEQKREYLPTTKRNQ